jgi:hypothetical protein
MRLNLLQIKDAPTSTILSNEDSSLLRPNPPETACPLKEAKRMSSAFLANSTAKPSKFNDLKKRPFCRVNGSGLIKSR